MQNLFVSKPAGSGCSKLCNEGGGALVGVNLGFLPDQTATPSEIAMAKMISTNNSGFSEIMLNDSGRTGSTLGLGIVGETE